MQTLKNENIVEPDGFVLLKITRGDDVLYKVFSSSRNDEYRISSGSRDIQTDIFMVEKIPFFKQESGSIYKLSGDENGFTFFSGSQLEKIREEIKKGGGNSEIVELSTLLASVFNHSQSTF